MDNKEFNELLKNKKEQKVFEDSVFLEFQKCDTYVSVYAEEKDNYLISEFVCDEDTELNEHQKSILQELVLQLSLPKTLSIEDNYLNNGVKPEDFF